LAGIWQQDNDSEVKLFCGRVPAGRFIGTDQRREIAEKLGVTEGTVKGRLHTIYKKLGVRSRSELIFVLANRGKPKPDRRLLPQCGRMQTKARPPWHSTRMLPAAQEAEGASDRITKDILTFVAMPH
jgi:hypothetical protein